MVVSYSTAESLPEPGAVLEKKIGGGTREN